jgi:hypothetical protein
LKIAKREAFDISLKLALELSLKEATFYCFITQMGKLPKRSTFVLVVFLVLIAATALIIATSLDYLPPLFPKKDATSSSNLKVEKDSGFDPTVASFFNGEVTKIDTGSRSLEVRDSEGATFTVSVAANSKITAGGSEVAFESIKVGDRVTLYSNQSKQVEVGKTYIAEWVDIFVPVDLSKLQPI